MDQKIRYQNWWSRLLLKKAFQKQHFIPLPRGRIEKGLVALIDKCVSKKDPGNIEIDKPIFIVGLPRSGTTMLYDLICSHEQSAYISNAMNIYPDHIEGIAWLTKKLKLNVSGERFFKDSIITELNSPSEPIMFWPDWFGRDMNELYWKEKELDDLTSKQQARLLADIKKIISLSGKESRFVCKNPIMQPDLKLLSAMFPDAKFIHIIRDGRLVANSLIKLYRISNKQLRDIEHPFVGQVYTFPRIKSLPQYIDQFGADDIRTTAHLWQDAIKLVNDVKQDLAHFLEIRYEDIISDPQRSMTTVFDFCELSWPNPDNNQFNQHFSGIGKVGHKNNYQEFDVVESIAGETLRQYRYID